MSEKNILEIKNLHVSADDKDILRGVDLTIGKNETHVLMGPNGTGKSTLGYAITGNPHYIVTEGDIIFDGENITEMPVNERAKKGIFLSFQNPLEVPGITLSAFIRSALEQKSGKRIRLWDFKKKLKETMELLSMDESYAERDLNVGFSGGEKKKAEILQMLMLEPKLAILDETDSGLRIGMEARLSYIIARQAHVLAVPYEAVFTDEAGQSCILVLRTQEKETYLVEKLPVTTGLDDDLDIAVSGTGVEEGLRVITDAKSYLSYIGKTVTLAQATGLEDMMAQMEAYQ